MGHGKVSELIVERNGQNQTYFTLEYFPPRTLDGLENLQARIRRMTAALDPSCVHITYNPSSVDRSLELIDLVQNQVRLPTCLHLTCTNLELSILDRTLAVSLRLRQSSYALFFSCWVKPDRRRGVSRPVFFSRQQARQLGVVNILALRGDPPRGTNLWTPTDQKFHRAIDLVRYIRSTYGDQFCIGVAGYPEPLSPEIGVEGELAFLKEKVDAGADFIVTQLFYNVENFISWFQACRKFGITVPIIPGIMPIQTYDGFRRLTALCKTNVPASIHSALNPIKSDDSAVREFGIQLSIDIIKKLQDQLRIGAFHISTLNLESSASQVVESLGWGPAKHSHGDFLESCAVPYRNLLGCQTLSTQSEPVQGGLPTTWDEFPNGRFGDSRSPAFDLERSCCYTSSSCNPSGLEAYKSLWGAPTSTEEITAIFCSFTNGQLALTPWSEEPLALETLPIKSFLLKLNQAGWWTVGSQPAVDGVDSMDSVFGFGPAGGRIYQKAFVEFFVPEDDLHRLVAQLESQVDVDGVNPFRYYAGRIDDEQIITNSAKGEINAVTWGVFRNAEVVTTTMIEESSFRAWKEDAFGRWKRWQRLFEPPALEKREPIQLQSSPNPTAGSSSKTSDLMESLSHSRWLCTIVHHDFKHDPVGLWNMLESLISSQRTL